MAFEWTDKIDDVDDIYASDINKLAQGIKDAHVRADALGTDAEQMKSHISETDTDIETLSTDIENLQMRATETEETINNNYNDLNKKISNTIMPQFVPMTKDSTGFVIYDQKYANGSGVLTDGANYTSYAITATDDFSCWFEECASVYTSLAIYTGEEINRDTFISRYRRYDTEDTLPTESNPLTVQSGNSIVVTVYTGYNFALYNDSVLFETKYLNNDISLSNSHIKQVKTELIKESKVRYEQKGDGHTEELAIYIPCMVGYLQYNFAHVVNESKNADNWHLWKVYAVGEDLALRYRVVTAGEWEMALHLKDRSDFSGGYMHGDEICTELTVLLDGKPVSITSLTELTNFKSLRLITKSDVYDPIDNTTVIAVHGCERIFENGELTINQNVLWQTAGQLEANYLAMFPIAKTDGDTQIVNKMYTDIDYSQTDLTEASSITVSKAKKVTTYGEETGLLASVEVLEYPEGLTGGNKFKMGDNGGNNYYKMYFVVASDGNVASGDIWKSKVVYKIDITEIDSGIKTQLMPDDVQEETEDGNS